MTESVRVLIVDDDLDWADLMCAALQRQWLLASVVPDGKQMEAHLSRHQVDLIVLDLGLPGEDGLDLCRRLTNSEHPIPVIVASARSEEVDRVVGLELGADDYLGKPFSPRELVARIRAVMRRVQRFASKDLRVSSTNTLQFGGFQLDLSGRTLLGKNGRIELTTSEFELIAALAMRPNETLSREDLLAAMPSDGASSARSIDVIVVKLRKLLEDDPRNPQLIKTVWGSGYILTP